MTFQWFDGEILDAVVSAKSEGAFLVILVMSEDEPSQQCLKTIEKIDLSEKICIPLRIYADSLPHSQLKEIYCDVPCPCVLILEGNTGKVAKKFPKSKIADVEVFLRNLPNRPKKISKELPKQEPLKKRVLEVKPNEPAATEPKKARIQLKLPSGENASCIMDPSDSLHLLRERAVSQFNLTSPFDLAVSYPRRLLPTSQNSSSLEELALCPTSTLLILPQTTISPFNVFSTFTGFFHVFFTYLQQFWNRIFA